jgi:polyferredoxin
MKRQKVRRTLLLISALLFPVTLNYLSPYLVIRGGFEGVLSGSALLFAGQFLTALFFGRAFCGWVCPFGTLHHFFSWRSRPRTAREKVERNRYRHLYSLKYYLLLALLVAAAIGTLQTGLLDPIPLVSRSFTTAVWPTVNLPTSWISARLHEHQFAWLLGGILLARLERRRRRRSHQAS